MPKSLVQITLVDRPSALAQKAPADRLLAWVPEPGEPRGTQHSVEVVMFAMQLPTCPQELAGKPTAEVVGLATVALARVFCGIPHIHCQWCPGS